MEGLFHYPAAAFISLIGQSWLRACVMTERALMSSGAEELRYMLKGANGVNLDTD